MAKSRKKGFSMMGTPGADVWYHVLRGTPLNFQSKDNHFQVLMDIGNDQKTWFTINVRFLAPAGSTPSDNVMYYIDNNYTHPITQKIKQANLPLGFTEIAEQEGGIALDYVRENLVNLSDFKILTNANSTFTDLSDLIASYINTARRNPNVETYIFGSKFPLPGDTGTGPNPFGINPNVGMHDIHMNQGSTGSHAKSNAPWQDGALLFHDTENDTWVAIFLAFETQVKNLTGQIPVDNGGTDIPVVSDRLVRVVAALINASGIEQGKEFVYLANTTNQAIDLSGWWIQDAQKRKQVLNAVSIPPLQIEKIMLDGTTTQLSNKGGIISLYDKEGKKVDGVSYTKEMAAEDDILVVF